MKRWLTFPLLILSLTLLLAACGTESSTDTESSQSPATSETSTSDTATTDSASDSAATDVQQLQISATNFDFNESEYTVKAGVPVNISFTSAEGVHGIIISGTDINLNDGDSKEVTLEAGEYEVLCSIPCGSGHAQMVSKLIVEA